MRVKTPRAALFPLLWFILPVAAYPMLTLTVEGDTRREILHLIVIASMLPVFLSLRALRNRVVAAAGRLCVSCQYDLSSSGERGICPECGAAFELSHTRACWNEAFPTAGGRRKAK